MILDAIAVATRKRVEVAKAAIPLTEMKRRAYGMPSPGFRFEAALKEPGVSFICEIKKASPSKGVIAEKFSYLEIARDYEAAGASCISILTEPDYFQGQNRFLTEIKEQVTIPLLRKDFTIDEYQLYEAKTIGADAVLLICALLDETALRRYLEICSELGLSTLVEAHNPQEIETALSAGARVVGVNNRDLKTFEVNLRTCIDLRSLVPGDVPFVAESGIKTSEDIAILRAAKVDGVLIGEALMKSGDRKAALRKLREGQSHGED